MKNNDTFTYALPNSKESRAGAMAFVQAMIKAKKSTKSHNKKGDTSHKEWCCLHDTSSQILLDAAGDNLSQHTIGVILTFAEFLNDNWITGYSLDESLESLVIEASLTKKQVEDKRQEFADGLDGFLLEENNVISLCAFRNK